MSFSFTTLDPLMSVLIGVLILIFPRFLSYFIAFYLIIKGIIGLGIIQ